MERSLNYKYGLKQVINASGRMSILGVSSPTDTVMDAMKFGGQNYVEIADSSRQIWTVHCTKN